MLLIWASRGELRATDDLLMDLSRGTVTRLTTEDSGSARWSPDGTRAAFSTGRTGILDL